MLRRIAGRAMGLSLLMDDVVRYLWLNVLWLVTCLTVVGIPAGTTAMHTVVAQAAEGDERPILPRYLASLRAHARTASLAGISLGALWALLASNIVIATLMDRVSGTVVLGLLGAVAVVLFLVTVTAPVCLTDGHGIRSVLPASLTYIALSPAVALTRAVALAAVALAALAFPPLLLVLPALAVRGVIALRPFLSRSQSHPQFPTERTVA